MMRNNFLLLLAALLCLPAPRVFARPGVPPDARTAAYLEKFRADYIQSMRHHQPALLGPYYAENVRLMPEFQFTVMGKSNALAYHQAFADRFDIDGYDKKPIETLDLGTRVVELGTFTTKLTRKQTGQQYTLEGKYEHLWEKSARGELALVTEAWNYSHPVPFGDQLRFETVPAVQVAYQAHVPVNNNISFQLAALNRLMEEAFTQHDANVSSRFFTDDAMFIYSANPIHRGRQALDAFFVQHMRQLPVFEKLDCRTDRIDDLGAYVIEYASHIAIIKDGDYSGVGTGKNLRIWRREKDGSLKLFRQMAMYD
ncbi:MAG: nuclear transport factor 2 family protein [Cytophagales bacterium]|nr:nuclear transport factor 2 family protein [Cytophagales bacterium]